MEEHGFLTKICGKDVKVIFEFDSTGTTCFVNGGKNLTSENKSPRMPHHSSYGGREHSLSLAMFSLGLSLTQRLDLWDEYNLNCRNKKF